MAKLNVFNSSKFSLLALKYNQTDFVAYVCVRACVCLCISVFVSVCNAYIIRNVTFTYWFPLSSCQYTLVTLKTTKTTKQIWWHTCARVWLCLSVSVSVCNAHVIRNVTWTFIYSFPHLINGCALWENTNIGLYIACVYGAECSSGHLISHEELAMNT